ncbi:Type I restriction modification system N6-adenine DNA methyltransferase (M) subunit, HsdM [Mycoplasma yeatsii 13926]|uniref:site-specific DNA-methyltransferase (adenine-specific) n=1 Tax=Mycoplasma yeatsii 13926 TaxID=1188240 RepID=S6G3N9_9MOLU|nr:class I SAM-dependent DNA methyltransferase [Mycoplasma yeatsii]EOA07067.1 Type I restriction modification system N6-adenine DNA methyltransferase (M) subunit, HsdM [Mycoplasma yeatsii 13926]
MNIKLKKQTKDLIDSLKAICISGSLGNSGGEYEIITQIFMYKFLHDKFAYDIKNSPLISDEIKNNNWEQIYKQMNESEREDLLDCIENDYVFKFLPQHLISSLYEKQNEDNFYELFDDTMIELSRLNEDIYASETTEGTKINIFNRIITKNIESENRRSDFAKAIINTLVNFSFEEAFEESYDFFASIFEYLIKDYNANGGGVYAEYYTPQSIAKIIGELLIDDNKNLKNISCYDPSAGTGTLVIALAHLIGEDKSSIYTQDISQKSSLMLELNLILNNLSSSLENITVGNTLISPSHKNSDGNLKTFDFVVSNPPFKSDFSLYRDSLALMGSRFWAGVPEVPKSDNLESKKKMPIYTLFIQHVINSIKPDSGKGAIVVPTGFITSKTGIESKVLKKIVEDKLVYGCISMPSNVFANTGTNVSVLFFDKSKKHDDVILIDASKLGEKYKDGKNQKVRLTDSDVKQIIDTFKNRENKDEFSVLVTYDKIKENNYSLSAGQYFEIKIEHVNLTKEEFEKQMTEYKKELEEFFKESDKLQKEILEQLGKLKYEI